MSVTISGISPFRDKTIEAIKRLREAGFEKLEVMCPVPDEELLNAVAHKPSKVGFITLIGGILGVLTGFIGATWAHMHWGLIIGGKAPNAIVPFVIVGFELTVLFGAVATLAGALILCGLPSTRMSTSYDYRVSEDHYVLMIKVEENKADEVIKILREAGAEVRR